MLRRYLTLWLVLSSGLAFCWPDLMRWLGGETAGIDPFVASKGGIKGAIVLTMFCIGGLLPPDEVRQIARQWTAVLFGTAVQFGVMPLLAWAGATLAGLEGDLRIGVLIVGAVPGAMASNVLTLAARGNVSYSVCLTTSATLLSPLVVPLALKLTGGTAIPNERLVSISIELLWTVVLPVIAGFGLCRWSRRLAGLMSRWGESAANLAILWIIAAVVGLQRGYLTEGGSSEVFMTITWTLLGINLLGYVAGYLAGAAFGLPEPMRRALTIEVGMQNCGVGTSLAMSVLSAGTVATIPTALYTFGCVLTGTLLAQWFARLGGGGVETGDRDDQPTGEASPDCPA